MRRPSELTSPDSLRVRREKDGRVREFDVQTEVASLDPVLESGSRKGSGISRRARCADASPDPYGRFHPAVEALSALFGEEARGWNFLRLALLTRDDERGYVSVLKGSAREKPSQILDGSGRLANQTAHAG